MLAGGGGVARLRGLGALRRGGRETVTAAGARALNRDKARSRRGRERGGLALRYPFKGGGGGGGKRTVTLPHFSLPHNFASEVGANFNGCGKES